MLLRESQSWATESRGDAGDDDRGREAKLVGMSCRKATASATTAITKWLMGVSRWLYFDTTSRDRETSALEQGPGSW